MDVFSLPDVKYRVKDVNGSHYRIAHVETGSVEFRLRNWKAKSKGKNGSFAAGQGELDEPAYQICGIENPLAGVYDDDQDIQEYSETGIDFRNGIWIYNMRLSHHHHIHVFGKGFHKLKSLEKSSSCRINMVDGDSITIESESKANVLHVAMYISERLKTSKLRYTHFLCFPLTNSKAVMKTVDTIQAQLKDSVMKKSALKSSKLHFTICMLNLAKDADLHETKTILASFQGSVSKTIQVELLGVQSVQEIASKARVVYTGGRGGEASWRKALLEIAAKLISQLEQRGLVDTSKQRNLVSSNNQVQLHATLFNSKYALGSSDSSVSDSENESGEEGELTGDFIKTGKGSKCFDATSFIDKYRDMIFGSVDVDEIRLCSLVSDTKDAAENDGFYKTEFVVKL
jgi:2'-5' RNA ligase